MRVLVTGSAGFIGFHMARRLLAQGHDVVGYDGLTDYYDVRLKRARHAQLESSSRFRAVTGRLEDEALLRATIAQGAPDVVLHFAAQAGVRYSLERPDTYMASNLNGTFNLLEALRQHPPRHLLVASTSAVYGGNPSSAFVETERTDLPVSIYAATKRGAEALTHSYAHLFGIPTTVARLFTVYGPWGRPDMAALKFADAIANDRPIEVFGNGAMSRDFTYIDDVIAALDRLIPLVPIEGQRAGAADSLSPIAPWRVVNLAGGRPVALMDFIAAFERAMDKPALKTMLPMQPGDVTSTRADTSLLRLLTGSAPSTPLDEGVAAFVDWFRNDWQRLQATPAA